MRFEWQAEVKTDKIYSHSDWGDLVGSRKSTSGGALLMGKHCMTTWSTTQGAVALSSVEAECYALVEAVLRANGLVTLATELGLVLSP